MLMVSQHLDGLPHKWFPAACACNPFWHRKFSDAEAYQHESRGPKVLTSMHGPLPVDLDAVGAEKLTVAAMRTIKYDVLLCVDCSHQHAVCLACAVLVHNLAERASIVLESASVLELLIHDILILDGISFNDNCLFADAAPEVVRANDLTHR